METIRSPFAWRQGATWIRLDHQSEESPVQPRLLSNLDFIRSSDRNCPATRGCRHVGALL